MLFYRLNVCKTQLVVVYAEPLGSILSNKVVRDMDEIHSSDC